MHAYAAGASGGPDTSGTGAGGFELGLEDDPFAGNGDFELGLDGFAGEQDNFFVGTGAYGERDRDIARRLTPEENKDASAIAAADFAGPPTPAPSDGLLHDVPNGENRDDNEERTTTKPTSKKPKSRKLQQPVRDKFITLHADEITKNREAYSDEMKKFNLGKDLDRFEKGQREMVMDMMTALPMGGKERNFLC